VPVPTKPCGPSDAKVKSSQVANPHNAFCIEQRTAAKPKEAQVRVFGQRYVKISLLKLFALPDIAHLDY
jgi:hypothetical protein